MKSLNRDRVYFLAKDPHWTFIWWCIAPETLERTRAQQKSRLTLRVHDITDIIFDGGNSHYFFDVEVIGDTDHWYLNIWTSNRDYCVEVGLKAGEAFCPMARSNTLCLPPDRPSDCVEERWSTLDI